MGERGRVDRLGPELLVKGADYTVEEVGGAAEVPAYGGTVVLAELTEGQSTTAMVARLNT